MRTNENGVVQKVPPIPASAIKQRRAIRASVRAKCD